MTNSKVYKNIRIYGARCVREKDGAAIAVDQGAGDSIFKVTR